MMTPRVIEVRRAGNVIRFDVPRVQDIERERAFIETYLYFNLSDAYGDVLDTGPTHDPITQ